MVKKILRIVLWVITGAALVLLFIFGRNGYLHTPLKGIDFQLERSHSQGFVQKDSILRNMESICDLQHRNDISHIDLLRIQKLLSGNPWIQESSAYIGLNDSLIINAREYEPMVRVFNRRGRSIYITGEGIVIPSSPYYTPRTLIASGNFDFPLPSSRVSVTDSLYAQSGLAEALAITKAIRRDAFLNGNIGQLVKNADNEYELMVNNLTATVLLGDTCHLDSKLGRLRIMLERYSGTEELNAYKSLNLKYKNQIVCTK